MTRKEKKVALIFTPFNSSINYNFLYSDCSSFPYIKSYIKKNNGINIDCYDLNLDFFNQIDKNKKFNLIFQKIVTEINNPLFYISRKIQKNLLKNKKELYLITKLIEYYTKLSVEDIIKNDLSVLEECGEKLLIFFKKYYKTKIKKWSRYDVIGVSIQSYGQFWPTIILLKLIKEFYPTMIIVAGGSMFNCIEKKELKKLMKGIGIKGIFFGQGLKNFSDFLKEKNFKKLNESIIYDKRNFFVNNTKEYIKLLDLPEPDYSYTSKYDKKPRYFTIQTGKGCVYGKCKHCSYQKVEKNFKLDVLSPLDIVLYVKNLKKKYNSNLVLFSNEYITTEQAINISKELKINKCKTKWISFFKLDPKFNKKDAKLIKNNCHLLHIGIESINFVGLKSLNKGYTPKQAKKFIDVLISEKIPARLNFIFNIPGQTYEDNLETYEYIKSIKDHFLISVHEFTIQPNTYIFNHPEEFDIRIFKKHQLNTCRYSKYVFENLKINSKELQEIRQKFFSLISFDLTNKRKIIFILRKIYNKIKKFLFFN
ncbi:radical SAM protein [Candidatus Woesearchaeota archaeon]|jgi:radical SAM superfamily enzyme YgiQ (UPF0313 family)|nr:radical SAM protein [Candidatus Woesearchaeota archaeon]